jgi:hypothetical protein
MSAYIEAKAARLLVERRVVIACGAHGIEAVVRGDHDTYRLFHEASGWRCTCAAQKPCSHALAVARVTS